MSSLRSAVASVIRLVAVGVILLGVVFMALAYAANQQGDAAILQWAVGLGGLLVGLFLLGFSSSIARALTNNYD